MTKPEKEWLKKFKAEYKRRVGITFEDGGGDDNDALRYHPGYSPSEAVTDQIERYDLDDITEKVW